MSTYESLLAQASQLSIPERLDLIDALWDTIPDDALPPLSDEWAAEIERRSEEFEAGKAETIPWEQIRSEACRRTGVDDAG